MSINYGTDTQSADTSTENFNQIKQIAKRMILSV